MCCFNQQVFGSIYAFLFSKVVEARAQPLFFGTVDSELSGTLLENLKLMFSFSKTIDIMYVL